MNPGYTAQFAKGWAGYQMPRRVRMALDLAECTSPEAARALGAAFFAQLPGVGSGTVHALGLLIGGWPDARTEPPPRIDRHARRAISISAHPGEPVLALCNDGTMWRLAARGWQALPEIPPRSPSGGAP